jgi:hypothetical protein
MATINHVLYTADNGQQYRVVIRGAGVDGDSLARWGWAPDDATKPRLPKWLKMRYVMCHRFSGHGARTRTVGSLTAFFWVSGPQRFNLPDADGTSGDWKTTSWFNEVIRKHS